jgi:hypothetical protein
MKQDWRHEYPLGSLLVNLLQTVAELLIYSWVVMFFWNYVMYNKLGLPTFTYMNAVGLFILSRFLLNDHLIVKDPIIIHCGCGEEIETPMVMEDKK